MVLHTFKGVFAAKKIKPDILHIHAVGPSLFVPFARMLGLKVVMTNHGPDYERKKLNWVGKAVIKLGEELGCKCANAVICISEAIAWGVREKYGRDVVVIPNGVELPELGQIGDSHQKAVTVTNLQRFGVEKGKYVLAVGRFVAEKGLDVLMEAFGIASLPAAPRNEAVSQFIF